MHHAIVTDGVAGQIRSTPHEGSVPVQDWVMTGDTTPDDGTTWYRNGTVVAADVPDTIPLWAFRASMALSGISTATVDALLDTLPEPNRTVAKEQWVFGNFIDRAHPLIGQLGAALGLNTSDIDKVFVLAATLA